MAGYDKFQIDMAKGRFTFPVAILICLLLRIITGNEWQDVINLLVCALTAYLLIEINTAFTLIRTRVPCMSAFTYSCPRLPVSAFLPVCRFFAPLTFSDRYFPIIQQLRISLSGGKYIPRFLFIGLVSLLFPQLLYFVPLFYLGMIGFRSLSLKSFFAGLTGLCVPYWLFSAMFYYDK